MNIFVTGAKGFIGQNLIIYLSQNQNNHIVGFDKENILEEYKEELAKADFVFHLAGVNRPENDGEFISGNVKFTKNICDTLTELDKPVPILFSSSIQAEQDNPYGISKLQAEKIVVKYSQETGAPGIIYRLNNVFGKWSRPNYNSVVATFCHNIARDLPIIISDREHLMEMVYIDDVVSHFEKELKNIDTGDISYREVSPTYQRTLGDLAELIKSFRAMRENLITPNFSDTFTWKLYGTYLSYLQEDEFSYLLEKHSDQRGSLAEFMKGRNFGQIFVSRTKPGVTRGNHYHNTKTEKFLVLQGEATVRFRDVRNSEVIEYFIKGEEFQVIDIPPGYTHSIENVGSTILITLFWASEIFDSENPDTIFLPVND